MPKRKKDDDDDDDDDSVPARGGIPNMANMSMIATEQDARVIGEIINCKFDAVEWLKSLDIQKLETLNEIVVKYKSREIIDTAIRSYSATHDLISTVEDYITLTKLKAMIKSND
jgi:hypothetical protein